MDNQQQKPDSFRVTSEGLGRFSKEEMDWIKRIFKDNEKALKTIRKIFLPEYDSNCAIGQIVDLWLPLDIMQIPVQDRELVILARNRLILHIEQQLQQISILAQIKDETPEERVERLKKDSSK